MQILVMIYWREKGDTAVTDELSPADVISYKIYKQAVKHINLCVYFT